MDVPEGARVFGDTGYNSAADEARIREATEVRLIPVRRKNMRPQAWSMRWRCARIGMRLKRSTAKRRRWALSACTPARMPGLN